MDTSRIPSILWRCLNAILVLALALALAGPVSAEDPPALVPWRDDFDGALQDGWFWLNEAPDWWNLDGNPGFLRIYASNVGAPYQNLLLRPVATADFTIETRVLFEPTANYQIAGLVIYQDDGNFLQLGRAFCDIEGQCVGNGIYFDKIEVGSWGVENFANPIGEPGEAYLRLEKRGNMVRGFFSFETITWTEIGTHWLPDGFQVNGVGLTASQDFFSSGPTVAADFDFFELSEGWNFLPEGYHDYDAGDVPDWACNAGGWAADPDDRYTDLAIEIVVDGATVGDWVYATNQRDDLTEVCDEGTCGFETSLWGQILSYEDHWVTTYAQDVPTGDWVHLYGTPKPLNCRSYDIYSFDPTTGETRQVTQMPETGEYNPSWSPDGAWIAHDVVSPDSHGIFITNVASGASVPLIPAQDGGNDAAWSPNGAVIAYDRRWVGDESIYLATPLGTTAKRLVEDAVSPNWSPNSQRLVFQRPSDGSIRTFDLRSRKVTRVAVQGEYPSWSPDGQWIAFSMVGEIWKVRVNPAGIPTSRPIQLTSTIANDNSPTWAPDNQTIFYNAGLDREYDIWSVPAAGGESTWLTGGIEFGDYDPDVAKGGSPLAFGSFTPNGQAPRAWVAAYTHDINPIGLPDGVYPYHFELEWTAPEPGSFVGQDGEFEVSSAATLYDGYALLRGARELVGVNTPDGLACEEIAALHPDQPVRFLMGWIPEFGDMTYADAAAFFGSTTGRAVWGDGFTGELDLHEVFPFGDAWWPYVCGFSR